MMTFACVSHPTAHFLPNVRLGYLALLYAGLPPRLNVAF
jgi:hypothetical protein